MTWIDRVLDLLHLLWFEVSQVIRNIWAHVRTPFWTYLIVVLVVIGATIASSVVVIGGVVIESSWVIFLGGIFLLCMIALVGVILIPAILGINIVGAIYARFTGGRP